MTIASVRSVRLKDFINDYQMSHFFFLGFLIKIAQNIFPELKEKKGRKAWVFLAPYDALSRSKVYLPFSRCGSQGLERLLAC